uniref:Uncharacterized protein n=1 Tax=Aegilops tauschii subsp. strangulata TaxID=200361 RepID=A0A453BDJ9_AEGTS
GTTNLVFKHVKFHLPSVSSLSISVSLQDARKRQLEHGQQSEASQSDGSKLWSGEQSELSYPSTPQSQRSSH